MKISVNIYNTKIHSHTKLSPQNTCVLNEMFKCRINAEIRPQVNRGKKTIWREKELNSYAYTQIHFTSFFDWFAVEF